MTPKTQPPAAWRSRIVGHGEEAPDQLLARRIYQREYMRRRRAERPEIREAERVRAHEVYQSDPVAGRERSRCWRENHPEYKAPPLSSEAQSLRNRRYYLANIESEKVRARIRRQTHPGDKRRDSARRKAMRRATECALSAKEIGEIRSHPCRFCGSTTNLTLAHDIPLTRGGETTRENCFSLCAPCNSRMHTRTLEEYRAALA